MLAIDWDLCNPIIKRKMRKIDKEQERLKPFTYGNLKLIKLEQVMKLNIDIMESS